MRNSYIALFCLLFCQVLVSCDSNTQRRNADLSVSYNGKVVYERSGKYASESELRSRISDNSKPIRVLFSSEWCDGCTKVYKFLKERNLLDHVLILNVDEEWVSFLMRDMKIKSLPTMIVENYKGKKILRFEGPREIAMHMINI